MNTLTVKMFVMSIREDSDEQLLGRFDDYISDEAKFAAACLLMASESNERKA